MLVKHPLLALLAEKPEKSKDKDLRCPPLPENARKMSNREDFSLMGLMRSLPLSSQPTPSLLVRLSVVWSCSRGRSPEMNSACPSAAPSPPWHGRPPKETSPRTTTLLRTLVPVDKSRPAWLPFPNSQFLGVRFQGVDYELDVLARVDVQLFHAVADYLAVYFGGERLVL